MSAVDGIDPELAVVEALAGASGSASGVAIRPAAGDDWPGVADPDALRAQLVDWLGQYANAGTRRTYAYALGLPMAWADALGGLPPREAAPRTGSVGV